MRGIVGRVASLCSCCCRKDKRAERLLRSWGLASAIEQPAAGAEAKGEAGRTKKPSRLSKNGGATPAEMLASCNRYVIPEEGILDMEDRRRLPLSTQGTVPAFYAFRDGYEWVLEEEDVVAAAAADKHEGGGEEGEDERLWRGRGLSQATPWYVGPIYVLSCQVYVKPGATLSIQAGVTIYATPKDENGNAHSRERR